jgi:hypothetical protein
MRRRNAASVRRQRPAPSGIGRIRFNLSLEMEAIASGEAIAGHAGTVGPAVRGGGSTGSAGPRANKYRPGTGTAPLNLACPLGMLPPCRGGVIKVAGGHWNATGTAGCWDSEAAYTSLRGLESTHGTGTARVTVSNPPGKGYHIQHAGGRPSPAAVVRAALQVRGTCRLGASDLSGRLNVTQIIQLLPYLY